MIIQLHAFLIDNPSFIFDFITIINIIDQVKINDIN